jgi:hypothetical protein
MLQVLFEVKLDEKSCAGGQFLSQSESNKLSKTLADWWEEKQILKEKQF